MASERLETKLRRLVDAKARKAKADQEKKDADAALDQLQEELHEEIPMEFGDISSVTIDLGVGYGKQQFVLRQQIYGTVINKDRAFEAFEESALSDELTRPEIAKSTLNELVQERIRNGQDLPDGVSFRTRRWIQASKKS